MHAIDTNVAARALLGDDPDQSPLALSILRAGAVVSLTVIVELGWLLRSRFKLDRSAVAGLIEALIDLPSVTVADAGNVRWAIARSRERGDLADLLHLVAATGTSGFVTFDAAVESAAAPDSPVRIETLA